MSDDSHDRAADRWDEQTLAGPPDPDYRVQHDPDPVCLNCPEPHTLSQHTRGGSCMVKGCPCLFANYEKEVTP